MRGPLFEQGRETKRRRREARSCDEDRDECDEDEDEDLGFFTHTFHLILLIVGALFFEKRKHENTSHAW